APTVASRRWRDGATGWVPRAGLRRAPAQLRDRQARGPRALVTGPQLLAGPVRAGLLRHRDDGRRWTALRPRPLRHGGLPGIPPPGRRDDRRRARVAEDGAGPPSD